MTSITDVLHHLVRRGLALRIETTGTLFIYDPRRYTQRADAVLGQHLPAAVQARSARTERLLLEEARLALTSALAVSTGAAPALPPATTTLRSAGAGMWSTGGRRSMRGTRKLRRSSTSAAKTASAAYAASTVSAKAAQSIHGAAASAMGAAASAKHAAPPAEKAVAADLTTASESKKLNATNPGIPAGDPCFLADRGSRTPAVAPWRGITWLDVPGHDVHIKKLNFALLKRGKLKGYKECAGLHGAALLQRLNEICGRNRDIGLKRQEEARLRHPSTPRPKPP
jgi:hypothetical protein